MQASKHLRSTVTNKAPLRCSRKPLLVHAAVPNSCWGPPVSVLQSCAACILTGLAVCGAAAAAPDLAAAQTAFTSKCAGCHVGGGNIIQPSATLFSADLARAGMDTPDALYDIIYKGKGRMPGFGTDCAPRGACTFGARLSDEEVKDLAAYVEQQAAAGWK